MRTGRPEIRTVILTMIVTAVALGAVASTYAQSGADSGPARASRPGRNEIVISASECAPAWTPPTSGIPTFDLRNTTPDAYEIVLLGADGLTVFGRVGMLGPGTQRPLRVSLPPGKYLWRCQDVKGAVTFSSTRTVTGAPVPAAPYRPVTNDEIVKAILVYRGRVTTGLRTLADETAHLLTVVETGDTQQARAAWLTAHLQYDRLGAAYGTFGDLAQAIDGRADGLPGGVHDKDFSGFHRLEYALWHGEPQTTVLSVARRLDDDVRALVTRFPTEGTGANDVSLRAHEILENALQFELTADTDEGSHTNLATVRANVDGTEMALSAIAPLLQTRDPALRKRSTDGLTRLATLLDRYYTDGSWRPLSDLTTGEREQLDATTSGLLETLSPIPDILERDPNDSD